MVEQQHNPTPILDFFILIYKNIKWLLLVNFIVAVITVVILLTMDVSYRSVAVVSVQEEAGAGGFASMISQVMPFSFGFGAGSEAAKYMGIIETKRVMDKVIDEFDLQALYGKDNREQTYIAFQEDLDLVDREDGTFSIAFTAKNDAVLAKQVIDRIYAELLEIALQMNQYSARNYRIYIEEALQKANDELSASEVAFQLFQEQSGIMDLENQVLASVTALTELETERTRREIELEFMRKTLSNDHPDVRNRMIEQQTYADKIAELKAGSDSYILSMDNLPENSLEYLRNYREVMIDSKIVEFLFLQYEQAKIEEQKTTVNLYLLDPPHVPDKKSKPKRASSLITVLFFSGLLSLIVMLSIDHVKKNREHITRKLMTE